MQSRTGYKTNVRKTGESVLSVDRLCISDATGRSVLSDVSLEVERGEVLALIGASGSGKTTLALSALGHLRPGLFHQSGRVMLGGVDTLSMNDAELRSARGSEVAYVAQSAASAFNPRIRLLDQVTEGPLLRHRQDKDQIRSRARDQFEFLNLPDPANIGRRYPWQVSGGQLQRFMLAMGMQEEPLLLVCDEPTSALDVTTQVEVMLILKKAIRERNTAALFVSHDLAVVAQIANRIAVMQAGRVIEIGPAGRILANPQEAYTHELMSAREQLSLLPAARRAAESVEKVKDGPVIKADSLVAGYGRVTNSRPLFVTVDDVNLEVRRGEVFGIIGESGSGKTTLARVLAGLHAPAQGSVSLDCNRLPPIVEQRTMEQRRKIQMVFQMADTALNPRHTVRRILTRVIRFFHGGTRAAAEARAQELLSMVKLPMHYSGKLVRQLSGGEKQRVNLARALAANPEVIICDEITSALDTVVAGSIIELIDGLRRDLGLAVIFVSHDLATVARLSNKVLVMRKGHSIACGATSEILADAPHPYVKLLIASVPELRVGWLEEAAAQRSRLHGQMEDAEAD